MAGNFGPLARRYTGRSWASAIAFTASALFVAAPVAAQDQGTEQPTMQEQLAANAESARQVLERMSVYLASQPNLTAKFDVDLDIITPAIEKINFAASGAISLSRPGKVHMVRIGGFTEVELISDGTTLSVIQPSTGKFSQMTAPGDVDAVIDMLRSNYGVEMPGADFLLADSYSQMISNVIEAKHIGIGVVGNVECEHLAFRNAQTDWQIWIRTGDKPVPCKYVISSKTVAGSPDYTVTFFDWATPATIPVATFQFSPKAGSTPVPFEQLTAIGELPEPAPFNDGGM